MRRNNFLVSALAALVTYLALSTFVQRPWGWHHRWHHHYYDDHDRDHDRSDDRKTDSTTY